MKELLDKAIASFEKQFNITAEATSFRHESDEFISEDYNITGLINSEIINIQTGGWFVSNGEIVRCSIAVVFDGVTAHNVKSFHAYYKNGRWSNLIWEGI